MCATYIVNSSTLRHQCDIFLSEFYFEAPRKYIKQQLYKTGDILSHRQSRLRHRINFSSKLSRSLDGLYVCVSTSLTIDNLNHIDKRKRCAECNDVTSHVCCVFSYSSNKVKRRHTKAIYNQCISHIGQFIARQLERLQPPCEGWYYTEWFYHRGIIREVGKPVYIDLAYNLVPWPSLGVESAVYTPGVYSLSKRADYLHLSQGEKNRKSMSNNSLLPF